jgi:hypothetical protein
MRIKYLSAAAAIAAGLSLAVFGTGTASAAPISPAAVTAPYHFSGIYLAERTENSCGFKNCAVDPLSLMIFSPSPGKYDLSANYGPDSTLGVILGHQSVWQPDIPLTWTGKAWQGTGTWNVVYCANDTLVPTKVTFVLRAPGGTAKGQAASDVAGTKTDVTQAGECGYTKTVTSVQTLNSMTLQPSWWNGTCDNGDTSTAPPADGGPFVSAKEAEWHGLVACAGAAPESGEYAIPAGPLAGDEEWQCAELAQRWLYLAFGLENVAQGNSTVGGGSTVALTYWNERIKDDPGIPLKYLTPGSPGLKPGDLSPGDVISYGGTPPGHVAIVTKVTSTHYWVIEQNPPQLDKVEMSYSNGVPGGYPGYTVAGWLHFTPEVTGQA